MWCGKPIRTSSPRTRCSRDCTPAASDGKGVAEYYASQPLGLKAEHRILETRRPADGLVMGYLDVDFTFTDRPPLAVELGILVTRAGDGWYISHYQVSRLDQGPRRA